MNYISDGVFDATEFYGVLGLIGYLFCFFITTLFTPSINGYGGSPKVHDSGCIKLFLVYFIFREVDMEYWRDLAKGTIGFLFYLEHL